MDKKRREKNVKQKPIFRFDYSFVLALGRIVRHCKKRARVDGRRDGGVRF